MENRVEVMMKEIDLNTWNRTKLFKTYIKQDFPYICLGMRLDVTNLLKWCKANDASFYFAMVHEVTKAANSIENFKYRFEGERVFEIDDNMPVFTHLKKDDDMFFSVVSPYIDDLKEFCQRTRELADNASHDTLDTVNGRSDIINITCIPWIDYTHFIRTIVNVGKDCNPKISWGKYVTGDDGRVTMNFSVQTHHGLMDGAHVGRFMNLVQHQIQAKE